MNVDKNYVMKVVATGLTVMEARTLEQTLISTYRIDYLENARREIAVGNVSMFKNYLTAINQIISGIPEDEIMNLMER